MSPKFSDEIREASIAHASINSNLAASPILLSATHSHADPLCHELGEPTISANGKYVSDLDRTITALEEEASPEGDRSLTHVSIDFLKSLCAPLAAGGLAQDADDWYYFRHHDLLMKLLQRGVTPNRWEEHSDRAGITTPQSLTDALQRARDNGYQVPSAFIDAGSATSYGEKEAFYAAREYGSNRITHAEVSSEDRDLIATSVQQVSSSFIIPNKHPHYSPFIADQLWIVRGPANTVRFLVLEIDGEHHNTEQNAQRDRARDLHFNSLGYEVYRVAGWWARIDPFRVVGEFLKCALGTQSFSGAFEFAPDSITAYRCDLCGEPMRRFDTDSISSGFDEGELQLAMEMEREPRMIHYHRECEEY